MLTYAYADVCLRFTRSTATAVAFLSKEEREFDLVSGVLSRETSRSSISHTPPSPQVSFFSFLWNRASI